MKALIRLKKTTRVFVIAFVLVWFALSPTVQAVVPPPDGGYPGFNTAEGQNALFNLGTGVANTGVGWNSLQADTEGSYNTGVGAGTLLFNGSGNANTAVGTAALLFNTIGTENTAVGVAALLNNDSTGNGVGSFNSAFGAHALQNNTDGQQNSAFGNYALASNTTGFGNTAIGLGAMFNNTEGSNNTAVGFDSLLSNTTGHQNTATGWNALYANTLGLFNTANGMNALVANTEGLSNTAVGWGALLANETGSNNTAIGVRAGQNITGSSNICIGSQVSGIAGENETIRIGDNLPFGSSTCYIGGIYKSGVDPATAASVSIDANNKLGTIVSSRRFKQDIQPMHKASEAILALKPVTFHYKTDAKNTPCFGLIAEEVAEVDPSLVVCDKNGEVLSVRYEQINAMLLNEFLKEHRELQEVKKQVAALTAGLQRVSAQLEASKPAPQVVNNP